MKVADLLIGGNQALTDIGRVFHRLGQVKMPTGGADLAPPVQKGPSPT